LPDGELARPGARMIDVGAKPATRRRARARATVRMRREVLDMVMRGQLEKGDALTVAKVAGMNACKWTPHLLPLCHPLLIDHCAVECRPVEGGLAVEVEVSCRGPTGVEMEAMTAAAVAALAIYDMIKPVDRAASIEQVILLEKEGGRSGHFRREEG